MVQSETGGFSRTLSLPANNQDPASPFSGDDISALFSFNINISEGSSNHSSPQYIT
jgi:hypothetical protein